ncbi:GNAT family N-acetyltransferase [Massilia sp. CCM 8733]|uniref:GNAT family N-acetyltransferase n=1 Tax=Massilia mucilaginosa TaxID=2609282 RepID=A0ABX0NTH8_9BURK|nr:GNAT family N-acetyltransferase [Massilia mucilaginosa]NHZ90071.1 GNAT family N-acetyltransferase [Massilia mucilaginosa]
MTPTLRPLRAADHVFLRSVYAAARARDIARSGWDVATADAYVRMQFDAQHGFYRKRYPAGHFDLVLDGDISVGRLYVAREAQRIHVIEIGMLPAYRNRGGGGALLAALQREAGARGAAVTTHVESNNRSMSLYRRFGFREIGSAGFHRLMEWRADAPSAPSTPTSKGHTA